MNGDSALLELRDVSCARAGVELRGVSLRLTPASFNLLLGDAGAALLLRLASLQERPDAGEVWFEEEPIHALSEEGCAALRSRKFGFVFSSPCLLPDLSLVENVAMPLFKLLSLEPAEAAERTHALFDFVGLTGDSSDPAGELSLFDQQRLALARALVHRPAVLVLDRPEINLPVDEAACFRRLVERACEELKVMVLATLAPIPGEYQADRVIAVRAGVVSEPGAPVEP
jgi:ABC-type ATPase involved in cell division